MPPETIAPARQMRILHAALFAGVTIAAIVMMVLGMTRGRPLPPSTPPAIGLVIAGSASLLIALAAIIVRPRIPARESSESADTFWTPARRQSALVMWSIVEAAGLLGVVGYVVSGSTLAIAMAPIAIVAGVFLRPGALEG